MLVNEFSVILWKRLFFLLLNKCLQFFFRLFKTFVKQESIIYVPVVYAGFTFFFSLVTACFLYEVRGDRGSEFPASCTLSSCLLPLPLLLNIMQYLHNIAQFLLLLDISLVQFSLRSCPLFSWVPLPLPHHLTPFPFPLLLSLTLPFPFPLFSFPSSLLLFPFPFSPSPLHLSPSLPLPSPSLPFPLPPSPFPCPPSISINIDSSLPEKTRYSIIEKNGSSLSFFVSRIFYRLYIYINYFALIDSHKLQGI